MARRSQSNATVQTRSRSPARSSSSSGRGRRRHRSPTRTRKSSGTKDPLIKALQNKDKKGRQGKERNGPLQPYRQAGKRIPRVVDPWANICTIMVLGLEGDEVFERTEPLEPLDGETEEGRAYREARERKAYQQILASVPNMLATFRRLANYSINREEEIDESMMYKLIEVFQDAARQARIADTSKVNNALCELMVRNDRHISPPVPHERLMRGWEHIDTGRFLCPGRRLTDYDEALLAQFKSGDIKVTAYDFPSFMYDEDLMEAGDIQAGLCRGFLLLRVIDEIYFGSGKPRVTKHATKAPIGEKLGITSITPEVIAYAATQARHALASTSEWPMQHQVFSLQDFYYNVIFLFDDLDDNEWAQETLEYLQEYFFPSHGRRRGGKKEKAIPIPTADTDIMKMRRQRAQRRQQNAE
ncbi:hypothetical protein H0H93_007285 [Arthromyces matolae]|nr:hypothetical protein H0H93_007285 [Arthromyces matolae]